MIPSTVNINVQTGWFVAIVATVIVLTVIITAGITKGNCK